MRVFLLLSILLLVCPPEGFAQDELAAGWSAFQRGDYAAAVDFFAAASSQPEAVVGLSLACQELGRYEESRAVVTAALAKKRAAVLHLRLGELEWFCGEQPAALRQFAAALELAPQDPVCQVQHAALQWHFGERVAARRVFEALLQRYRTATRLPAPEIALVARACIFLERFHEANRLFEQAVKLAPQDWRLYLPWGELFLEKYNQGEAAAIFREALQQNPQCVPAQLGLARCQAADDLQAALEMTKAILVKHPNDPAAHVLAAELLLMANHEQEAAGHVATVLKAFPNHRQALGLQAVLADRRMDQTAVSHLLAQVAALNPRDPVVLMSLATDAARRYLFKESVDYYRRALALDDQNWAAVTGLGISLSRLGQEQEAKQLLETAYRHDPFHVPTVNLLNLFDEYEQYDTLRTPHFLIRLHRDDRPVIGAQAAALCEAAYQAMAPRYRVRPPLPITVEIFPKHDDFAVRCFGLPGAEYFLGICFGPLVAMNSPRARARGEFNWQETLWHEIAHVMHLERSGNRIPRSFAEGLAVYEAAQARSEWGMNMELAMIRALRAGQVLPLHELDESFTGQAERVALAYYQAAQMVEFITQHHGFDKVLALLPEFKQGRKTEAAMQAVLRQSSAEFDRAFQQFLREKFQPERVQTELLPAPPGDRMLASPVALPPQASLMPDDDRLRRLAENQPNNFFATLLYGKYLAAHKQPALAEKYLRQAKALLPAYVGADNPYQLLADLYWQQGRQQEAVAELEVLTSRNGEALDAALLLADWQLARRDSVAAAAALARALAIYPYDLQRQRQFGQLALALRQPARAAMAFEAVLGLQPPDRAGAHCELAAAYLQLGKRDLARKHARLSLEIAPDYERAQEILLRAVE
ncbi:MAG: tetratricopeptide repeat protein [candidate division KSB1 bacterium]|nr:tetratricopeptide repeat protein [candidate division KSB1 bacterium]MDZ7272867.1 tetratricopeptide repeat protein [candidate division KSB1 bacterium]MDZ7284110.1 tetratricopeptide repeat protein [candidate division KSB1 bacterium]MDZ7297492.1 tetratricopeptide repeat protein [candidate division KSB1 bacterium]MDZ7305628.1 tetratricopeptide repeat protein [candidate division KSB1 bacterium]